MIELTISPRPARQQGGQGAARGEPAMFRLRRLRAAAGVSHIETHGATCSYVAGGTPSTPNVRNTYYLLYIRIINRAKYGERVNNKQDNMSVAVVF